MPQTSGLLRGEDGTPGSCADAVAARHTPHDSFDLAGGNLNALNTRVVTCIGATVLITEEKVSVLRLGRPD